MGCVSCKDSFKLKKSITPVEDLQPNSTSSMPGVLNKTLKYNVGKRVFKVAIFSEDQVVVV